MEYYSAIKNKTHEFCMQIELENIILSEGTQTHMNMHNMYSLLCGY